MRQLDAAKEGLRRRGGPDPLDRVLAAAGDAAAAAAAAGVQPGQRGRTKQWDEDDEDDEQVRSCWRDGV